MTVKDIEARACYEKMTKFIVTNELGRLARWLRILGYDTLSSDDKGPGLVVKSLREDRIILTRSAGMARFTGVRMVHITSDYLEEQLGQVMDKTGLVIDEHKLFTVCVVCDANLERIGKQNVKDRVPEYVHRNQESFMECPGCKRVYWQGSHWNKVQDFLSRLKGKGGRN